MGGYIGIDRKNLGTRLRGRVLGAADQADRVVIGAGSIAVGALDIPADVVEGETVTIGDDIYEFDVIATDSGKNTANGEWNNTDNPIYVTMVAHGREAGDLLRVENEIVKILRVIDVDHVVVARGRCGTAVAAHADALDIFQSATPPASNIPLGLNAVLTGAVAIQTLEAEIVNELAGAERATAKASTIYAMVSVSSFGPTLWVIGAQPEVLALALATSMAGVGNAWRTPTMEGGASPSVKRVFYTIYNVTAEDVTTDQIRIFYPFTASWVNVTLRDSSDVIKPYDGALAFSSGVIQVGQGTLATWADGDQLIVSALE